MDSNLEQLYSLRRNFTIIGVTGRVGSGCSRIGDILASSFSNLNYRIDSQQMKDSSTQKRELVFNFCKENWKEYKVIEYKRVLLFLLLPDLLKKPNNKLLYDFYRNRLNEETDENKISLVKKSIQVLLMRNEDLIIEISKCNILLNKYKGNIKLKKLGDLFWSSSFNTLADQVNNILFDNGITERKMLLHHISNNYRKSGKPFKTTKVEPNHIFCIAKVINKLIKATKVREASCHVVIDSFKNSLEINFFKERYSAFYLIAVKNDNRHNEIKEKYGISDDKVAKRLIEMDDLEYSCSDFVAGQGYTTDLQNCIQISDYHINVRNIIKSLNKEVSESADTFHSIEEQLFKLQALIQQPSLITPEPIERIMQLAFTARLNSGCISRQVGAAITDVNFSVKSIGWNDVPKGTVPCSLRNVKNLNNDNFGFSQFEIGKGVKETENISDYVPNKEIDTESTSFNEYVTTHYTESNYPNEILKGRNCPYCFKSAYNSFKGEKNQVHTRSLHAEENAMLQISKFGGQALEGGYLFTTASTCELCAKKAYQLGIKTIYYIDPYPGISRSHILKSNVDTDPNMVLFSGAVGRAYLKFYEPFISQKDEIAIMTGQKLKEPEDITKKKIRDIIKDTTGLDISSKKKLDDILKGNEINTAEKLVEILKKGLESF